MKTIEKQKVINTDISLCSYEDIIKYLNTCNWKNCSEYISVCNVYSVMTAYRDKYFQKILNESVIATPDGMPLVWNMRLLGNKDQNRVDGPNLMLKICESSGNMDIPIFLYGNTEECLNKLELKLKLEYPNIKICGKYSPPFRKLTHEEDQEVIKMINESGAKVTFVSLGAPKQEVWMYEHKEKVNGVMVGVGAAFDFIVGNINRAPLFMQNLGLEWLYRLVQEPKKTWKKYIINNPLYIVLTINQGLKIKFKR